MVNLTKYRKADLPKDGLFQRIRQVPPNGLSGTWADGFPPRKPIPAATRVRYSEAFEGTPDDHLSKEDLLRKYGLIPSSAHSRVPALIRTLSGKAMAAWKRKGGLEH